MNLTPSLLNDWRSWDGVQNAFYESARHPIADPFALAQPDPDDLIPIQAKPRPLTRRERFASGGAYVAGERVWLVPVAVLPDDFLCKPADVVYDRDKSRYTVLVAELNALRTFWRLQTLNLAIAHDLRDSINIERATQTQDAAGVIVKSFPPDGWTVAKGTPPTGSILYGNLRAKVQLRETSEVDTRGQRSTLAAYDVIVERQVFVSREDRVSWVDAGGVQRYLDIKGMRNPERIDELPRLEAELRP